MMPLPTDIELVEAAAGSYSAAAIPFIDDLGSSIRIFRTLRADGFITISIEGTHDALGWALDFFALKITDHPGVNHPSLGFIHAGFYAAALLVINRISAELERQGQPFAICGHSLGAAMALLIGGLLIDNKLPPAKIGAFAPPRVGGQTFMQAVTSVPFCAYRYGADPVPLVPFYLPDFPYRQVPFVELDAPPTRDIFANHHIANYVAGVTAIASIVGS